MIEKLPVDDALDSKAYCLILRHMSGSHAIQFSSARNKMTQKDEEIVVTFVDDQRTIVTTNGKQKFNTYSGVEPKFLLGIGIDALINAHLERISGLEPVNINSRETLFELITKMKNRFKENLLKRGIYESID